MLTRRYVHGSISFTASRHQRTSGIATRAVQFFRSKCTRTIPSGNARTVFCQIIPNTQNRRAAGYSLAAASISAMAYWLRQQSMYWIASAYSSSPRPKNALMLNATPAPRPLGGTVWCRTYCSLSPINQNKAQDCPPSLTSCLLPKRIFLELRQYNMACFFGVRTVWNTLPASTARPSRVDTYRQHYYAKAQQAYRPTGHHVSVHSAIGKRDDKCQY